MHCLLSLQLISRELSAHEKDYVRFMQDGCSLPTSPSADCLSPNSTLSLTDLTKSVKFSDEDTLQRRHRRREIRRDTAPPPPPPPPGQESSLADPLVVPEAVDSPNQVVWQNSPYNSGTDARTDAGQHTVTRELSLTVMPQDSRSSLASIFSQLTGSDAPLTEELYELSILWVGVWAGLNQYRQRLEGMQVAWRRFEDEKESFCRLLKKLEGKAATFLTSLTTARDFAVIQGEIAAQKVCCGYCALPASPSGRGQHVLLVITNLCTMCANVN